MVLAASSRLRSLLVRGLVQLAVCSTVLLTTVPAVCAQETPPLQTFQVQVSEGTASGWFRWAVDPVVADSDTANLTIVTDGHCSLYINGQRVLKNVSLNKSGDSLQAAGYDVKSLLRQGRNLIAVEVNSDVKTATFGVSLLTQKDKTSRKIGGPWKIAPAVPPVGWQQTDFNDRDWPEAKPLAADHVAQLTFTAPSEYAAPVIPAKARTAPFEFEDGDRVVFVGATFFERAQLSEHLETTLTRSLGRKHVTFRNLGWSADTAYADSRGIFDRPDVGYLRMVEHIRAEEPTVAFICYGQNEALTSRMTAELYAQQLSRLLDELAASGIACVLVSPHELLPAPAPIPSPARFNPKIKVYSEAMASVAQSRGLLYLDLFTGFTQQMLQIDAMLRPDAASASKAETFAALSDNGIHLGDHGYRCAALVVRERLLGIPADSLDADPEKYETTRSLIQKKNELYFHRWRPQNITYLFGFRKHEQGNNAADIARFDPFIQGLEKQIHELQ